MDDTKMNNIVNFLEDFDWTQIENMDINIGTELLIDTIQKALDQFAPLQTKHISYKNILRQPWMTPALLKSSHQRELLYRRCLGKPKNIHAYTEYTRYTNLHNRLKNTSKQNYYAEELTKFQNDTRKTWKVLNSLLGRKNDKSGISELLRLKMEQLLKTLNLFLIVFVKKIQKLATRMLPKYRRQINLTTII